MLSFFPRLYEDELLYSWLARYHLRSCNISPKMTMKDLFGSSDVLAIPDLPTHLDTLFQQIKHFGIPDIKVWIKQHTFFNYYTAFCKEDVRQQVLETMIIGNRPGAIHMMTGVMASNISESTYFRYCPYCVEEDINKFGETYWHMSHQLPGVLLCLKHDYPLLNSSERFRGNNKQTYVAATTDNCTSNNNPKKFNQKTMSYLREIADNILRLSRGDFTFSCPGIQRSYKYFLQKEAYATVNGTVHQRTLAEEFRWFYGDELLAALQSQVNPDNPACWLKAITRKHRKSFHPIRHILFIRFFGEDIDSFYQYANRAYQPFGPKPYPCLNKAAHHYKQPVITNLKVTICTDTRKPVGTFCCSCGFNYSRRGPDQTSEDRYKIGTVKQFGPVWREKLQKLIHFDKLSYCAAAKELNVDISTVKKYADGEVNVTSPAIIDEQKLLGEKQAQWLKLQTEDPNLSKTQLRKLNPALFTWLYRHAHKWLDENSPKKQVPSAGKRRVDWKQRDNKLVMEIKTAVRRLYGAKEPLHVNISKIGKEIGKLALLERHLDKMPLSAAFLNQVTETREQFQIRRVHWVARQLFERNEEVHEWKINRLAGLKPSVSYKVKREVKVQVKRYFPI